MENPDHSSFLNEADEMGSVVKNIYTSCDPENTDCVPVSTLIEFIKPYMIEDLHALEDLKIALDPENRNVKVTSRKFYEVMSNWSKKVANSSDEEDDFNRSPSQLDNIDDKELPYCQSTPRASFGEKLLKNKDLLNLSNVSTYSLSKLLDNSNLDSDKTLLEETVKKLEHQLSKVSNELALIRSQLAVSEEQNDNLQSDLERVKKRLHSEQQVIEHLQKEKTYSEDLKEELDNFKKLVVDLKKKLSQSEKDSQYLNDIIKKTEEEKDLFEKKYEQINEKYQDARKEIYTIKTELDVKEQEVAAILKAKDELEIKFSEQRNVTDNLKDENELLSHQKSTLEKAFRTSRLSDTFSPEAQNFSNLGNSPFSPISPLPYSPRLLHQIKHPVSPDIGSPTSPAQSPRFWKKEAQKSLTYHVLMKNRTSDTNITEKPDILDSSLPESVKSYPVLSPLSAADKDGNGSPPPMFCITRSPPLGCNDNTGSEEELFRRFAEGSFGGSGEHGHYESLKSEMFKADDQILVEKEKRIIELEDQVASLKQEIEFLRTEKNNLQPQIETLTSKVKELEEVQSDLLESNFVLTGELECNKTKLLSVKETLTEAQNEIKHLKEENDNKDEEIKVFKEHICKNNEQILIDLDTNMKTNMDLQSNLLGMKIELTKLKTINEGYEKEIKDLRCKNGAQCLSFFGLSKKLKDTEAKLQLIQTENETKLGELKAKDLLIKEKEEQIKQLKIDINNKDETYTELQSKLDEFTLQLAHKSVDLLEAIKCKETLQMSNKSYELKIKELEEQVNGLHLEKIDMTRALQYTESELKETQQNVLITRNVEKTLTNVQQHIDKRESFVAELQSLNERLRSKVYQAEEELNTKISEVLELKNQLKKDVDIKNDLWRNLNNLKSEVDKMKEKNEELIQKEQKMFMENEHYNHEHNLLLNIYDVEVIKNSKLNKQISDLIEERDSLKEKYAAELKVSEELKRKISSFNDFELTLATERDELLKQMQENREIMGQLQTDTDVEVIKNLKLNKQISDLIEERDSLKEKYESELKVSEELKRKISSFNDFELTLATERDELLKQMQENREIMRQLQTDTDVEVIKNLKLNKQISDLIEERDSLKEKYAAELKVSEELRKKISSFNTERDQLLKEIQENREIMEQLETNTAPIEVHNKLQESLCEKVKINNELVGKIKELNEENTKLLSKYREQVNVNNELNQRIFSQKEEINNLQSKETEFVNKVKRLSEEITTHLKEKEALSAELKESSDNQSECSSLSFEIPKSKSFQKQQITIERLKEKVEHLQGQLELEKSRRNDLLKCRTEVDEKLADYVIKFKELTNENENLNLKLAAKQTRIESLLEDCKELEGLSENSEERVRELKADIKRQEQHVQSVIAELEEKDALVENLIANVATLEAKLQCGATELTAKENKIQSLTLKTREGEDKYQKIYTEWIERGHKISSLEEENRKMQEAVSKSDDHKKRELMDVEEKISSARQRLELSQFDLELLNQNVEDVRKEYSLMTKAANKIKQIVFDGRNDLERVTRLVFEEWKKCFDSDQVKKITNQTSDLEKALAHTSSTFEDQIHLLDVQIKITSSLLECVVSRAPKMETVSTAEINETESSSETKRVHKFTLKAPTLILSRPVSPDSPSLGVDASDSTCSKNLVHSTKEASSYQSSCQVDALHRFSGDETSVAQQTFICTEPKLQLPLFDSLDCLDLDISNNTSSPRKFELEPYFTALAVELSTSGSDVKERLDVQTAYYKAKQEKFANLMMDITSRLRDHICIGTSEPIMPVFVLLEELKILVNELLQITGQMGLLSFEQRMRKPWNLVIAYVTQLKEELDILSDNNSSRSESNSTSGLRRRRKLSKTHDNDDKNAESFLSKFSTKCAKSSGLRSPKLTLTIFMVLVLFVGCVLMHWHCRANATSHQDCPFDTFITKSRVGPPPL